MLYKKSEKGQGLVHYAIILVLVAIVVICVLVVLGLAMPVDITAGGDNHVEAAAEIVADVLNPQQINSEFRGISGGQRLNAVAFALVSEVFVGNVEMANEIQEILSLYPSATYNFEGQEWTIGAFTVTIVKIHGDETNPKCDWNFHHPTFGGFDFDNKSCDPSSVIAGLVAWLSTGTVDGTPENVGIFAEAMKIALKSHVTTMLFNTPEASGSIVIYRDLMESVIKMFELVVK